ARVERLDELLLRTVEIIVRRLLPRAPRCRREDVAIDLELVGDHHDDETGAALAYLVGELVEGIEHPLEPDAEAAGRAPVAQREARRLDVGEGVGGERGCLLVE